MSANIPGLKSGHQIITPTCRQNRGTTPAFLEAAERLQRLYDKYARSHGSEDVHWHLVLVREDTPIPEERATATVIERLLSAAKLLYANAEGCAVNHYAGDFEQQGLPGWLIDCKADIEAAARLMTHHPEGTDR
jgi:hypothetical protein